MGIRRRMMMTSTSSQIQELYGLWYASPQERRIHVLDEGSWCKCPSWCCWSWCTRWIRQIQGNIHCLPNGLTYLVRYLRRIQSLFHADINIIFSVHIFIKCNFEV